MKAKYKKFDQYFKGWYFGFEIGYRPYKTWAATRLIYSQMNVKLSDKMKELREVRKNSKLLHNVHHRISQKDQRVLRECKKM